MGVLWGWARALTPRLGGGGSPGPRLPPGAPLVRAASARDFSTISGMSLRREGPDCAAAGRSVSCARLGALGGGSVSRSQRPKAHSCPYLPLCFSCCPWSRQVRGRGGLLGAGRDAFEGKGPQRRLGRRLEEVAEAVGGGYCRLQMPLRLAGAVRGTVARHRLGALAGPPPPPLSFQCIPGAGSCLVADELLVRTGALQPVSCKGPATCPPVDGDGVTLPPGGGPASGAIGRTARASGVDGRRRPLAGLLVGSVGQPYAPARRCGADNGGRWS